MGERGWAGDRETLGREGARRGEGRHEVWSVGSVGDGRMRSRLRGEHADHGGGDPWAGHGPLKSLFYIAICTTAYQNGIYFGT